MPSGTLLLSTIYVSCKRVTPETLAIKMISDTLLCLSHNSATQLPTFFKLKIPRNLFNFHVLFFFFLPVKFVSQQLLQKNCISKRVIICTQSVTPDPKGQRFNKEVFPSLPAFNETF